MRSSMCTEQGRVDKSNHRLKLKLVHNQKISYQNSGRQVKISIEARNADIFILSLQSLAISLRNVNTIILTRTSREINLFKLSR